MPYTAIVNTYLAAKPLFGNAINTTTQFMLNIIGTSANTPVSSSSIDYPTVEDPDPIVIPDDPTPAPPAVMTQSVEGWSCYSNYLMNRNTVIAELSSTDPRLTYTNIYVGSTADGCDEIPEEWGDGYEYEVFNGEEGGWYDLPANCYGDTICAQVAFSNGVRGLVALSTAPPTVSRKIMVYNVEDHGCIGGWAVSSACKYEPTYPFAPVYDDNYYWADIILMDTSALYDSRGGMDYALNQNYEEGEPGNTYTYTISGRTFYLYFIAFKPNSDEYTITVDCDLPTLTVEFPFIICDENGNEIDNPREHGRYDAEYGYFYHTNGTALVQAIATASGLTV